MVIKARIIEHIPAPKIPTRGRDRDIQEYLDDPIRVPPEVWQKFGEFAIKKNNGYLYARIKEHKLPYQIPWHEFIAVSKLVWNCHFPTHNFSGDERILYINGDKQDNRINNLKLGGI